MDRNLLFAGDERALLLAGLIFYLSRSAIILSMSEDRVFSFRPGLWVAIMLMGFLRLGSCSGRRSTIDVVFFSRKILHGCS